MLRCRERGQYSSLFIKAEEILETWQGCGVNNSERSYRGSISCLPPSTRKLQLHLFLPPGSQLTTIPRRYVHGRVYVGSIWGAWPPKMNVDAILALKYITCPWCVGEENGENESHSAVQISSIGFSAAWGRTVGPSISQWKSLAVWAWRKLSESCVAAIISRVSVVISFRLSAEGRGIKASSAGIDCSWCSVFNACRIEGDPLFVRSLLTTESL